jgi:hypothetical protein
MEPSKLLEAILEALITTGHIEAARIAEQTANERGVFVDNRPIATSALPPTNNINP